MKRIPTDLEILTTIYERYYDAFVSFSPDKPNRSGKIMVPIDVAAIANELGVDGDIVFGRLYQSLEKRYGYTHEDGSKMKFFALKAGKDRHCINFPLLASVLVNMREVRNVRAQEHAVSLKKFPTPPGTEWRDVRITITNLEIRIQVKDKTEQYSYQDVGFEDRRRKAVPNANWNLLKLLAVRGGTLESADRELGHSAQKVLKNRVSELRRRIKALVPDVDGDSITYDWAGRCYRTTFKIHNLEQLQIWTPAGTTWTRVSIADVGYGVIRISFPRVETTVEQAYEDIDGQRVRHDEPAQQEETVVREYDLRKLGLKGENGKLTGVGNALLGILRSQGRLQADQFDKRMLALNKYLSNLFDLEDSPFDFSERDRVWRARFEASSEPNSPR